jgi:hypothetical protein
VDGYEVRESQHQHRTFQRVAGGQERPPIRSKPATRAWADSRRCLACEGSPKEESGDGRRSGTC